MTILGIETSCDETAAAVVRDGREILSNVISSQVDLHRPYGGVVPELAARNHLQLIDRVIADALAASGCSWNQLDAVAATYGPGLASSLLVGLNAAKGIALAAGIPFVGINHLEAHLYSPMLTAAGADPFPMVGLVVSGGHTLLVRVDDPLRFAILGRTVDDAAGEAFDKVAKLLGLGYPGGPAIDRLARSGNPAAIPFPRGMLHDPNYDFSFSGLKTAVMYYLRKHSRACHSELARNLQSSPQRHSRDSSQARNDRNPSLTDICASFQAAVVDVLVAKTVRAARDHGIRSVAAAGGVSLNSQLRARLQTECDRQGWRMWLAPAELCTDNAAMIAARAHSKLAAGGLFAPSSHRREVLASRASDFAVAVTPSCGLQENA